MDPQTIIDTATSANAVSLAQNEAAKSFRNSLANSFKIPVQLKTADREYIRRELPFPVIFTNEYAVTNDHPMLVALRNLTRDVFESEFHIAQSSERVLIVGAAMREITKYNANPHIHYWVAMRETKDYDRVIRPALMKIAQTLKRKLKPNDYACFLKPTPAITTRPVAKRYANAKQILDDYMRLEKMPGNIHIDPVQSSTLVFEDSIYNYTEAMICELFETTGAHIAYGYALLPWELAFPNMPPSRLYNISQSHGMSTITFRHGYCNGYSHSTDAWSTLMRKPALSNGRFSVVVEITSRVGPYAVFKLMRTVHKEVVVRTLELPEVYQYVELLDLLESVDLRTFTMYKPLKYFSVNNQEYYDLLNYLLALDSKSVTLENAMTFVRRRMGGMSLVTKELVAPWNLPKNRVYKFCLTVYMQVRLIRDKEAGVEANFNPTDTWQTIKKIAVNVVNAATIGFTWPVKLLYQLIFAEHLVGRIVLYPDGHIDQTTRTRGGLKERVPSYALHLDFPNEESIPSCPTCRAVYELGAKMGDQIIECTNCGASGERTLGLTDEQVATLRNSLIDNDNDPIGLKAVKDRAAKKVPVTGFEHKCTVHYIRGGPGCGKSWFIRAFATTADLVYAPYTKLKPDYEQLVDDDGAKYDIPFKTTHRGLETTGHRRMFVDEFTSMPYEYLATVAYLNAVEEIYLVGDLSQPKTREPSEGLYVANWMDVDGLPTHTLKKNFRNPPDAVALMNRNFGYKMLAHKPFTGRCIEVVGIDALPDVPMLKMGFSHATCALFELGDSTVRANQGGTSKIAAVYLNSRDGSNLQVSDLTIVALTRHTEKLYLVTDKSPEATAFIDSLKLDADFYDHIQTFLTFQTESAKAVTVSDPMAEEIIRPQQPPKDAYLILSETLSKAHEFDITNIAEKSSQVVVGNFATGTINVDELITPTNLRHHPKASSYKYRALDAGLGFHFTGKMPLQTLRVLEARYLCPSKGYKMTWDSNVLAMNMVNLFVTEHMKPRWAGFAMDDIEDVVQSFLSKVLTKKYQSQFVGIDNPDANLVRFHLKDIFKPKMTADLFKAGQGISALSKDVHTMYAACWLAINKHFRESLNDNVIYDNGISEADLIERVAVQRAKVPATARIMIGDFPMYDSSQNGFTQQIERALWRSGGVSDLFLDAYFDHREKYTIQSDCVRGDIKYIKGSGFSDTLTGNSGLTAVLNNYIARGAGPCTIVIKGDDFNKTQCMIELDSDRMAEIAAHCPIKFDAGIGTVGSFCGYTIVEGQFIPDIYRKANKLAAHRFRSYTHFAEYQKALRDTVNIVEKLGRMRVVAGNAELYGTSYIDAEGVLDCLNSFSHIDEAAFLAQFKEKEETAGFSVRADTAAPGTSGVLAEAVISKLGRPALGAAAAIAGVNIL